MNPSYIQGEDLEFFKNYVITSKGRVWSCKQQKWICENVPYKHPNGLPRYRDVSYMENGKHKTRKVSQVVMKLFGPKNPNPDYYDCVDHIDQDIHHDSIENLRYLPKWQNCMWTEKHKGYSWNSDHQKYCAQIKIPVKQINLGYYDTHEEARAVYLAARDRAMQLCLGDFVIRTKESIISFVKTGNF